MPEKSGSDQVQGKPNDQSPMQTPINPPGDQDPPPPPANGNPKQNAADSKELEGIKKGEYWLIGIGILTLVVNSFIAFIYYGQLKEMVSSSGETDQLIHLSRQQIAQIKRQANDTHDLASRTKDLADNALKQVTIAKETFEVNDRPYVDFAGERVSVDRDKHSIFFAIVIMNTGNIPAEDVDFNCDVFVGDFQEPQKPEPLHTLNARMQAEQRFTIQGQRGMMITEGQKQLIAYCHLRYKWRNNREERCGKRTYVSVSNIFIDGGSECGPKEHAY